MTLSQASMRPIIAEEPECILLVEDEFLIRAVFAEEFRERGYRVIEAINADEALIMINASPPDLVITDIRMPGAIDGLGLLAIIRKEHPDLPVTSCLATLTRTTPSLWEPQPSFANPLLGMRLLM